MRSKAVSKSAYWQFFFGVVNVNFCTLMVGAVGVESCGEANGMEMKITASRVFF